MTEYNLDNFVEEGYEDGPAIDTALSLNPSEVQAVKYVASVVGGDNLDVLSDRHISAFSEYIQPLTSSLNVRPGLLLSSSTNGTQLPMFCLEVHSGEYINTVAKSVANLIDQLRLLSCFYPHLSMVSGFVFPKLSKRDDNDKITDNLSCVTQVDVEWVDLEFKVNFKVLDKSAVRATVKSVIGNQLTQLQTPGPFERYFVRLLPRDIAIIRRFIEASKVEDDTVEHLCQVDSKFSILVKSQKKYYKMLPRTSEVLQMMHFVMVVAAMQPVERPESIVMPINQVHYKRLMFFVFDAQDEHPLNKDEAKECLGDLVVQIVTALKQLHRIDWAHLDVRLPNICFTRNGNVRLIDLDRINHKTAGLNEYGKSFFYENPENGSTIDVDWRQLGLLIYYVQTGVEIQKQSEVARASLLTELDPFLKELIVNFKMDERLLESWRTNLPQGSTVEHVLQERCHSM